MKKFFAIEGGRLVEREEGILRVYAAPTPDERAELRASLGIHDYDLDSALDPDEISRVEFDRHGTSIIWKRPSRELTEGAAFNVGSVGFFLRENTLTILSHESIASFGEKEFAGVSSIYSFLLRYFFFTIRQYLAHLKAIKRTTAQLEVALTSSVENKELLRMFELSESLVYYHDAIESNGSVLAKLKNRIEKFPFTQRQLGLLDDAIIENAQCAQQANIYSHVLAGLMDARGNIINNNMNVLLKNLTIINVVFLPLGLFASMGGMSEYSLMLASFGVSQGVGYMLFSVVMVAVGLIFWALLRRRNGSG
ncbi:hypothetical protein A3A67_05175 [Candidatus Peribacteria bacterium RIFCSPLOWO2_01_FULL_51_18]|nr:MAG: hypothetical protein A3C52_03485 [Candidatus Peribacteria bacterium RIFCSPHIGHO2_02_FULL_51_15]OGJ66170.1 MAG: hypothetical protein A3A67_05175 [Candidatus Peribacteria bacterium RIFCSPLOWO2_01_FULL_51_18]